MSGFPNLFVCSKNHCSTGIVTHSGTSHWCQGLDGRGRQSLTSLGYPGLHSLSSSARTTQPRLVSKLPKSKQRPSSAPSPMKWKHLWFSLVPKWIWCSQANRLFRHHGWEPLYHEIFPGPFRVKNSIHQSLRYLFLTLAHMVFLPENPIFPACLPLLGSVTCHLSLLLDPAQPRQLLKAQSEPSVTLSLALGLTNRLFFKHCQVYHPVPQELHWLLKERALDLSQFYPSVSKGKHPASLFHGIWVLLAVW